MPPLCQRGEGTARAGLAQALDQLADVLYPHLRREEDEMMPVVSAAVTEREWREWDPQYNIKPLRPLELADPGLWILDGLDGADRATVAAPGAAGAPLDHHPPAGRPLPAGRAYRRWRLTGHSTYK